MITADQARNAARSWVESEARRLPGYRAAFVAGSVANQPGSAIVPPWSDTDVMVILDGEAPAKAGKFHYQDVLLEGTYLAADSVADPETVLASYHAAHAFANGVVVDDPTGWLAERMTDVRREFPRRSRVEARSRAAFEAVRQGMSTSGNGGSLALDAQSWVFPTGVMTHVLLVSGLRNPTVRRRYETTRELLEEHGQLGLHERLLGVLGSDRMTPEQAMGHLNAVAGLFDFAATVDAPSYRFASDVTPISRPISIDGTRDMIARGYQREAAFWLVVTASRALQKLAHAKGDEAATAHEAPLQSLLADLGIRGPGDLADRRARGLALLPDIWKSAQAIMDATPGIREE